MKDYKGPKNYFEMSTWHVNRMPFKTERIGQAFFNDFGFQTQKSYYCEDPSLAWEMIVNALTEIYPDFVDIDKVSV